MILKHTNKISAECENGMQVRIKWRVGRESLLEVQDRKEPAVRSIK